MDCEIEPLEEDGSKSNCGKYKRSRTSDWTINTYENYERTVIGHEMP